MDYTAIWFLTLVSVVGYLAIGLVVGAVVSNLVHRDGGSVSDARMFGGISAAAWWIAIVILLAAGLWHFVISPLLTPKAAKEKARQEKAEREASGKPTVGAYVD